MRAMARARAYVSGALEMAADPAKAPAMQAYMKTDMPFFGVQKAGRTPILRQVLADFAPTSRSEYEDLVLALWSLPLREEKYIALGVARASKSFVVPASLPLYTRLIVEGAWWDLVDEVATHLVRELVVHHPLESWPEVDRWIDAEDLWLRRAAIICQVGAKQATDEVRLFRFCGKRAHEPDFFIRKAIGWALRDYAKTEPDAVAGFVQSHQGKLSNLSLREATKHIGNSVGR